ncbi:SOS response-associated peptidase family protein [Bosea sp. Root483D1]|uniref:SOS response-associated peptidase family protein n=1 Tax=Bosea sp. Root483D1 TaxID=1736544 RepID=UPI0009E8B833|nr:SOS response-associated peptidase family protein [Bosea sp. Root483D1]
MWERWRDENGEEVISARIITPDADRFMKSIHNRMPAMLHPNDFDAWLDGSAGKEILMKAPPGLQEWIVNRPMNNVRVGDDDPATAVPAEPEAPPLPPELPPLGSLF